MRGVDEIGDPPLRRAVVRFTTRDGREFETPMQLATSMDALRTDDPVLVLYDPDDPTQAQLERHRGLDIALAALAIFLGVVMVGTGTLGMGIAMIASDVADSFDQAMSAARQTP